MGAGKMPYASGLPYPKGLKLQTPEDKMSAVPVRVPTVAPPEFDHHRTKAPREPALPLPNHSGISWKRVKTRPMPGKGTVAPIAGLDSDTIVQHIHFAEAYLAPVPEGFRRPAPKRSKKHVKDLRGNKLDKKVISALADPVGSSADQIDTLSHRSRKRIVSALKASREGSRTLMIAAERALHYPIASINTHIAKRDKRITPSRQECHTFDARNGSKMYLKIYPGLTSGDVERPIRGHDWTKHFDCVLSLSQYSWITGTRLTAALYFHDLPARLKLGVPWRRPSLTQRVAEKIYHEETCECCTERPWASQTSWRDRSPQPQFAAVITVGHLSRTQALGHNAFEIMRHARTEK